EVIVEARAEVFHVAPNRVEQLIRRVAAQLPACDRVLQPRARRGLVGFARDGSQICARILILLDGLARRLAEALLRTKTQALAQRLDLFAAFVAVVLALRAVAAGVQQTQDAAPYRRSPRRHDHQGTGRIGGDVLDLD